MSKRFEHLHYCEYRDTETGLVACNYVDVMNEQDQKIKDLEAKLAESEKSVISILENTQLKQQLAEKDLKIIELETKLNLKDKETNV